jgi:UDP-N-acetylglucosamine/UDP-N-acetylgalactosamine diphosphorylase
MLPVGPVSHRTLFQIHIDKLLALGARFGRPIPLYIMTSPATDRETRNYLERHDWFGYPDDCRTIFCQGTMPAVDAESGKVLLAGKSELFLSPDGHGGMLEAFDRSGCIADLNRLGICQVFYGQVDNPLSQLCDAAMLGYHILAQSEMSSQAIPKTGPLQNVGNLVSIDGKIHVIEYSDLPDDVACQTRDDGSLKLWAGSIAVHVFDVGFLNRVARMANALPFHLALKKVPHIDTHGHLVNPDLPNALKFERFIFDLLPMAAHSIVVEVDPHDAFSPVKNASGESTSTVETAGQAMLAQARRALRAVGVEVPDLIRVEIAPELLYDSGLLARKVATGQAITQSVYLK